MKIPILKSGLKVSIFIFWLVMMGLLVKREVIANFSLPLLTPAATRPEKIPFKEDWMGIYYNGSKIGYSNTIFQDLNKTEKGLTGYTLNHTTFLSMPILGEVRPVEIQGNAFLDSQFKIKAFQFNLKSGKYMMHLKGERRAEGLSIKFSSIPEEKIQEFIIDPDIALFSTINPAIFLRPYVLGKVWLLKVFDPLTLTSGTAAIKLLGKEMYSVDNQPQEVLLLETTYKGIQTKAWVTYDGRILRQESPLGLTVIKEPKEKAVDIPAYNQFEKDILSSMSVPSNLEIPTPKEIKYLLVKLEGVNLADFDIATYRQKLVSAANNSIIVEVAKEDISGFRPRQLPLEDADLRDFLKPQLLVESDNPKIIQMAKEIIAFEKDCLQASLALGKWVFQKIRKSPSLGLPSAVSVLENKEGDCNEHTYLYVALARAGGIPAKIITGLVYYKGRFYYHTWPKVFVGRWFELDPTLGQEAVDATHIQFLEGGLERQVDILKLIRKLKLKVIEFR